MEYRDIVKILEKYKFFGFTVKADKKREKLSYTFHSIPYFAVHIVVDTVRLEKDKIVTKVHIGDLVIEDEKELIPKLKNIYDIHKKILFGKKDPFVIRKVQKFVI